MKKLFALFALGLLLSATLTTAADARWGDCPGHGRGGRGPGYGMLQNMDTNDDGEVTEAEAQAFHAARFAEMDADGNGAITKEEVRAHHQKVRDCVRDCAKNYGGEQ